MVSDEYWKEKTVGRQQVTFAWVMVALLAAGAHYADLLHRAGTCERTSVKLSVASSDDGYLANLTSRNPR